jgi:hypothetical protein
MNGRTRLFRIWPTLLTVAVLGAACSSNAANSAPVTAPSPVAAAGPATTGAVASGLSSAVDIEAILVEALQDEYHALYVYERVLRDFGTVYPFANIVIAERRHAASIGVVLSNRAWTLPASAWSSDNVPAFPSIQQACATAAQAEIDNIALYDRLLTLDLPTDVRTVFQNNRQASLSGHLPAFQRCR